MRIGNWIIFETAQPLNRSTAQRGMSKGEMMAAFRVGEDTPWFIGILQMTRELEEEMVDGARKTVANTNMCVSATGGGEACALLRERLARLRENAVRGSEKPEVRSQRSEVR